MNTTIICNECHAEKERAEFPHFRGKLHGRKCKSCKASYHRRWMENGNRDRVRAHKREYTRTPTGRELRARYRETNKDRVKPYMREYALRTKYGLSSADYSAMVAAQGGHCACCGGDPTMRGLVVDHDHETGAVRALLCEPCNQGLGCFRDNPEVLCLAVSYLKRHAAPPKAKVS